MKRRRRGGAAPQAGACDVWLDTAAQPVVAERRVAGGILERQQVSGAVTPAPASRPRCKQSTIPACFSARAGEKDKENSRLSPSGPNKDCKVKAVSAATSPVKILALPGMEEAQKRSFGAEVGLVHVTPQACAQKALALPPPLLDSWLPHAEPHSEGEGCCGVGEDSCNFSFTQDSQGNRVIGHRNKSHGLAGETVSASSSVTSGCGINKGEGQAPPGEPKTSCHFLPRPGANQHKKPEQRSSVNSLIDFTDTENINPATVRDGTWAGGVCTSPCRAEPLRAWNQNVGAGSAKERWGSERGPSSPCRQLFTQDSEGNRVIAHSCQNLPSPLSDLGSSPRQLPSSACKGCPSEAVKRSWSKPGEQWSDVCYDLLFTQDSEGNRVIKHSLAKPQESVFW